MRPRCRSDPWPDTRPGTSHDERQIRMQEQVAISAQIAGARRCTRRAQSWGRAHHADAQTGGVNDPHFRRGAASRASQGGRSRHGSLCVDVCAPFAGGIEHHPKLEAPAIGSPVRTTAWQPVLVADLKLRRRFTRSATLGIAEAKYVRTLWPPLRPHPWAKHRSPITRRSCGTKWARTAGRERPPGRGRDAEGAHRGGSLTPPLR